MTPDSRLILNSRPSWRPALVLRFDPPALAVSMVAPLAAFVVWADPEVIVGPPPGKEQIIELDRISPT